MNLGIIAGCISLIAFVPYLIAILKGKTKPNRVTWWIWSLLGILLFLSYRASGATNTLWVAATYMITPALVALLSIWYGAGDWSRFDTVCLGGAIIGTVSWFVSGSSGTALLLFISIDIFGLLPTIKKAYLHPDQEDSLAWLLMVIANLINLFAVDRFDFFIILYPLYLLLSGIVIFVLSVRKVSFPKKLKD